ncbi:lycopene cyclase family protein [Dyadobacter sediminis]|uniref:Lycopene cyclase n=1 Tax=Dyadobacter sediminis TaxID=1493691 RepID=A0A5R9KI14_9BACT|nr:lycopene cyclase family protein [Dyadobacter sediminis]TLU95863.1 lycopene cyclase [Dyadobacter sediminis]GGB77199.1 lycopene cyclase [Dyadobacter sediminis]
MQTKDFDIIFAGSGMAGLSLAYRGLREGIWQNESILIVDKDIKNKNDRTWCFWQHANEKSPFQEVFYHSWKNLFFFTNEGRQIPLNNGNYAYHMIRSIDFYQFVLSFLRQSPQVTFVQAEILSIENAPHAGTVQTRDAAYKAKYVFNSTFSKPQLKPWDQYFLQHFKGIMIQTKQFSGNPSEMHLMDFRTTQENGTTFFYVLPVAQDQLFIEYTVFSKKLLEDGTYDLKIKQYLNEVLEITEYEILEHEFGIIPMTDFRFSRKNGPVMNIGTAGGDTRGSSGYTFTNTQKTVSKILASFREKGHPFFKKENISEKHQLLDSTILKVLDQHVYPGHQIFSDLFTHVDANSIFAFLDSESTARDDLKIMLSLKAKHFIAPFVKSLFKISS